MRVKLLQRAIGEIGSVLVFNALFLLLLLCTSCGDTAGATDVEVGGVVSGIVANSDGHGSVTVSLVPTGYKPGIDAATLKKVDTVIDGYYEFRGVEAGDYHLLFRTEDSRWAAMTSVKAISTVDSLRLDTVALERSGMVKVVLSELGITGSGTLFLQGTDLSVEVTAESDTILFDGVPGSNCGSLIFASNGEETLLVDEVNVESGKLTELPYPKKVLFINDGNQDITKDYAVYHRFKGLFREATVLPIAAVEPTLVESCNAVVLLPSVTTLSDLTYWKELRKPIMVCSHELWRPLGMVHDTDTAVGTQSSYHGSIEEQYHPILDSLYESQQRVPLLIDGTSIGQPLLGWGVPAETGRKVVNIYSEREKCLLFTYEQTAKLADESNAAHHRLGLFSLSQFDHISDEGWWLYKRSLYWVTGIIAPY